MKVLLRAIVGDLRVMARLLDYALHGGFTTQSRNPPATGSADIRSQR